ncbi:MAG: maleylpyruvate isomerase family mycothiol-dependent enzyme [Propionibacteriaceae bacterium]|jgi:maleylpyruvate isomerase|nr:maleylpyruvate isomerase family mycothiol-dependent enzyme [Propionibacteriaceae bacterium]
MRRWEADQTSLLLGDTISLSEAQWHESSLLPGWSRAHIATHLARNADDIGWVAVNPRIGLSQLHSPTSKFTELERGADRPGLSLQIDLDTSAGALARSWVAVTDWHRPVRILTSQYPLSVLPLIRLHEVCVHHLDLEVNASLDQIEPAAGAWLLKWVLHRMESERCSEVSVLSETGVSATIGRGEPKRQVRGTDAQLWAWLSGRVGPDNLDGANGLEFVLLS